MAVKQVVSSSVVPASNTDIVEVETKSTSPVQDVLFEIECVLDGSNMLDLVKKVGEIVNTLSYADAQVFTAKMSKLKDVAERVKTIAQENMASKV